MTSCGSTSRTTSDVGDAMITGAGTATGTGNDELVGFTSNDLMVGDAYAPKGDATGSGDDHEIGGDGRDTLVGDNAAAGTASGGGHDTLIGFTGNDLLVGDNQEVGNAKLKGGGPDLLKGGDNNDRFDAGPAKDTCQGGTGTDKDLSRPRCEKRSSIP